MFSSVSPVRSAFVVVERNGRHIRNLITYNNCRQSVGKASIKFDEPAPDP
jgi:hypothetical protein